MYNCMETFYKGKNVTDIHLLDLQLQQDWQELNEK